MGLEEDRAIARKIRTLLKAHPKGLIITEIAQRLGINRNSAAKYLEILLFTGQVEIRQIGMAKIYTVSQRVPLSGLLRFAREQIVVVDDEGRIIQANDRLLDFWQLPREALLGERFDRVDVAPLRGLALPTADGTGEAERHEISFEHAGRTVHARTSLIPTVFEDGGVGCTILIEDVTAEREYERQIAENEARYRAVVEDQTEMITRFTPDHTVTFANEACRRFFQAVSDDLIGHPAPSSLFDPGDLALIDDAIEGLRPDAPFAHHSLPIILPGGEQRWLDWTARGLFNAAGTLVEVQAVGRDVTEAQQRQRDLMVLESAIAASIDGVAICDDNGRFKFINRAFISMFGFDGPADLVGMGIDEFARICVPGETIVGEIAASLPGDRQWFGEIGCRRRDERPFIAQVSVSLTLDEAGRYLCTLVSVVDITERRRTEEALQLSRGKLQETIEFMPDATFIVNRERRVVAWNRAMESLSGIGREEVTGTRDYGRAFARFDGVFPVLVDLLKLSTEELARTYPGVRRFGETLYFETPVSSLRGGRGGHLWGKASPLASRDGSEIGAIQTLRDISDWKRAEESYRSAIQRESRLRRLDGDGDGAGPSAPG